MSSIRIVTNLGTYGLPERKQHLSLKNATKTTVDDEYSLQNLVAMFQDSEQENENIERKKTRKESEKEKREKEKRKKEKKGKEEVSGVKCSKADQMRKFNGTSTPVKARKRRVRPKPLDILQDELLVPYNFSIVEDQELILEIKPVIEHIFQLETNAGILEPSKQLSLLVAPLQSVVEPLDESIALIEKAKTSNVKVPTEMKKDIANASRPIVNAPKPKPKPKTRTKSMSKSESKSKTSKLPKKSQKSERILQKTAEIYRQLLNSCAPGKDNLCLLGWRKQARV